MTFPPAPLAASPARTDTTPPPPASIPPLPPVLPLVPAAAERIFAGKASRKHVMPQETINEVLVTQARSGRRVVRLKGGDPFIFGRGSEEALHLARHRIPFEIVPGITASMGCAAYAGIPLTHRGLSKGVHFVTGHMADNGELDLDWDHLADPDTTLVIYMGLMKINRICNSLVEAGLPKTTPAAAIQNGHIGADRTPVRVSNGADVAHHRLCVIG